MSDELFGIKIESNLQEGDIPLQVICVVRVLDSKGDPSYRLMSSGVPLIDQLGPLRWAFKVTDEAMLDATLDDDDDD